jgi:hypothetical protein
VAELIIHPYYSFYTYENDVVLLKMIYNIPLDGYRMKAIPLAESYDVFPEGTPCLGQII